MNALRYITAAILGSASLAFGQMAATTPAMGYEKLEARGLSDTYFGVPLVKRSIVTGRVASVSEHAISLVSSGALDQLAALATGQSYYVQFVTGNLTGVCLRIVGVHETALILESEGEDLTAHTLGTIATGEQGDVIRVRPAWRVSDLFGSTSTTLKLEAVSHVPDGPYIAGDAVLTPAASSGDGLLYYVLNEGWRSNTDPSADAGNVSFLPGTVFGVRRQASAAAEILVVGDVSPEPLQMQIPPSEPGTEIRVAVSLANPRSTRLSEAGLFSDVAEESILAPAASVLDGGDWLLEWDRDRVGMALPPKNRFHVVGSNWYDVAIAADDHLLEPGRGYVLRLRSEHGRRYWRQRSIE